MQAARLGWLPGLPQIGESLGMHIFLSTYFSLYFEPAHQYVFDQRMRPQTQTRRTVRGWPFRDC
jgi:hypothetical protein